MHLILNDGRGILLSTKSKRKILMKATLFYKPQGMGWGLGWGEGLEGEKVAACSPEFTKLVCVCMCKFVCMCMCMQVFLRER